MRVAAYRALIALIPAFIGTLVGAEGIQPTAFWGVGTPLAEGLKVPEMGYVRWDFHGLSDRGDHFVLQVAIWAKSEAPTLPICLRLSTPALGDWRLFHLELNRMRHGTFGWLYFSQVSISRRDLGLGSSLWVRLDPAVSEVDMWVSRSSVVLQPSVAREAPVIAGVEEQGYAGSVPQALAPVTPLEKIAPSSGKTSTAMLRELPETERIREAVFIAPGVYTGEIGWPGPGVDMSDWYKVNVRPGQTIRVALAAADGGSCGLALYDSRGMGVASARAGCELALEYRAEERGPWYIQISCSNLGTVIPYTLRVEIRT